MGASRAKPSDLNVAVMAQLAAALRRIEKLEATVATLSRPAADIALVAAIYAVFADAAFLSAEVTARARSRPELYGAILASVGQSENNRKLGNKLGELCMRQDLGGLVVVQLTRDDRAGSVWMIRQLRV